MGHRHHALSVDFNYAMANSNTSAFSNTTAQQTTYLPRGKKKDISKLKYVGVFFYVFFYAKDDPEGATRSRQKTEAQLAGSV